MMPADDLLTPDEWYLKRGNSLHPIFTLKQAKMFYDVILTPFNFYT